MTLRGFEIETESPEVAARVVKALGAHRYVLGRSHEVHVFAVAAAADALAAIEGSELVAKADAILRDDAIDPASRDERLMLKATDAELAAVVSAFWAKGPARDLARTRLAELLAPFERSDATPFEEDAEDGMFPVLIDAGWELLPLSLLDEERHRGVIESFDSRIEFENARFCEEDAIPAVVYLIELPAMGAAELLDLVDDDDDSLVEPLVVWSNAPLPYVEYLVRGVTRSATK